MSHTPSLRGNPRWSVVWQPVLVPALMAALVGASARVNVGPPLFARLLSPTSVAETVAIPGNPRLTHEPSLSIDLSPLGAKPENDLPQSDVVLPTMRVLGILIRLPQGKRILRPTALPD